MDNQKNRIFKTCLQEYVHKGRHSADNGDLIDLLKANRDRIKNMFCDDSSIIVGDGKILKHNISGLMTLIEDIYIDTSLKPILVLKLREMERAEAILQSLRSDILYGVISFDHIISSSNQQQYSEWGGSGFIITSDPQRKSIDSDILVLTNLATPISWLLNRIKSIHLPDYNSLINLIKKYLQCTEEKSQDMKELGVLIVENAIESIMQSMNDHDMEII